MPTSVLPRATAERAFQILMRFLRDGLRALLLGALGVAAVTWSFGRSRQARAIRGWARVTPRVLLHQNTDGPVSTFVTTYATAISLTAVGLGLTTVVLWDNPGATVLIIVLALVLLVVGLVLLLRATSPDARKGNSQA